VWEARVLREKKKKNGHGPPEFLEKRKKEGERTCLEKKGRKCEACLRERGET